MSGAAHPPRTAAAHGRSRLRPSAARLGLAALGAALGLEFGLVLCGVHGGTFLGRPLPPFGPLTNESQATALARGLYDDAEGHGIGAWDRDLGWTLLAHGRSEDGTQTVNSSRSRGPREYLPERAPGGLRLLCFGDSFTFGDEVPDAAAYPAQLEALGAERGLAVEALNFGLPGGGTDQALLHFRRERGRWSPDVVAIGLLLENIGRNVNRYRPRWSPHTGTPSAKPRFLLDAQGELVLLPSPPFESRNAYFRGVRDGVVWRETAEHDYWDGRPDLGPLRFVATARVIGLVLAHRERQPRRLWQEPEGEPFRVTVALLETFHREALAAGARAAPVLIFPEAEDLRRLRRDGECPWETLLHALDERQIPYLDLSGPLAELAAAIEADPTRGPLYVSRAGHLAPAGNRRVAEALWAWLAEQGLLAPSAPGGGE